MEVSRFLGDFVLLHNDVAFVDGSFLLVAGVFNRLSGAVLDSDEEQQSYQNTVGEGLRGQRFRAGDVIAMLSYGEEILRYEIGAPRLEEVTEAIAFEKYKARASAHGEVRGVTQRRLDWLRVGAWQRGCGAASWQMNWEGEHSIRS